VLEREQRSGHRRGSGTEHAARQQPEERDRQQQQRQIGGVEDGRGSAGDHGERAEPELATDGTQVVADGIGGQPGLPHRAPERVVEEQVIVGKERCAQRATMEPGGGEQDHGEREPFELGCARRRDGSGRGRACCGALHGRPAPGAAHRLEPREPAARRIEHALRVELPGWMRWAERARSAPAHVAGTERHGGEPGQPSGFSGLFSSMR
jgi:hypothetical protein